MNDIIKKLGRQILNDLDSGNSYLTEEEEMKVIKSLRQFTRKDEPISKYQAYTYLRTSRATFDNLVSSGKIPKGKKIQGLKELFWYKKDLDKYLKNKKDEKIRKNNTVCDRT